MTDAPGSPAASTVGATTVVGPTAEMEAVQELLTDMKTALSSLGLTFDTLGEHTARVAALAPAMEVNQQIQSIRRHMRIQDKRYDDSLEEVKTLLKHVLQEEIIDFMRHKIDSWTAEVFQEEVQRCVGQDLEEFLPVVLQEQINEHRRQLEDVKRALHNSESRRANSLLRYSNLNDQLHTLLMPNGEVSGSFPKTLSSLFALDGPAAKQLALEYQLPDVTDSRERNLNRFMQHIGVMYQMARLPDSNAPIIDH